MFDELPTDDDDSDADVNEDDRQELNQLTSPALPTSGSAVSASVLPSRDILMASDDEEPTDVDSESDDEDESGAWSQSTKQFTKLQPLLKNIPVVDPSLMSATPLQYFESIFSQDLCDLIVAQTHLYKDSKRELLSSL